MSWFTGAGIGVLDGRYVNVTGDTMTGALQITPTSNSVSILDINQADGTAVLDVDTTNRKVIVTSGTTGQSTIGAGLIVNNDSGSGAINDFQVNSDTLTAIFVDASADTLVINVPLADKLKFTQTDGNEYIDSLADGYMDYRATTGHRFNSNAWIQNGASLISGNATNNAEIYIFNNGGTGANQLYISDWTHTLPIFIDGITTFNNKVIFTQTDGNEYIDSNNDGYMDYGATTRHRFNTGDVDVVNDLTAGTIQADDGFTGSFTNGDGATVTVVGGVITGVA